MKSICGLAITLILVSCMKTTPPSITIHGHRGCRGVLPENSIPGFLRAIDDGAGVLEFDVVCTGDSRILVSHDPFVHSEICLTPDGNHLTEENQFEHNLFLMTLDSTQRYVCGTLPHPRFPEQQAIATYKPSLHQVFEAVQTYCRETQRPLPGFNIEIKSRPEWDQIFHPDPNAYTTIFLNELRSQQDGVQLIVQSFDLRILQEIRKKEPALRLVLLNENPARGPEELIRSLGFVPFGYSPHYSMIDEEMVQFCKANHLELIAWTVNDENDIRKMIDLGVRQIISDFPARVVAVRDGAEVRQ